MEKKESEFDSTPKDTRVAPSAPTYALTLATTAVTSPSREEGDPGFIFQFASATIVHSCMDTLVLQNIQPSLSRGKL